MFSSRHETQSRRQLHYHQQQSISKSRYSRSMDDVSMQVGLEPSVNTRRYQKYGTNDYFPQASSQHNTRPKYPYSNDRSQNSKHEKYEKRQRQYYNDLEIDTSYFNENHQVKHFFFFLYN